MAQELRGLESVVDDLQTLTSALVLGGAARDDETIRRLQHFDRLAQTIVAIAGFAEALGDDVPAEWSLNPNAAARVVLLSNLAARLVSHMNPSPNPPVSGELEMF
jgi:hypothetical protein